MKVANEDNFSDVTDLYDKMKKLQKHQAFESEIKANQGRLDNIKKVRKISYEMYIMKKFVCDIRL